jgi:hypothetical protein
MAVFVLGLSAQVAVTPLNEGMDFGGHLAYVNFVSEQGRPPAPDELSVPEWVGRLTNVMPGPDFTDGTRYQAWARLDPDQRRQRVAEAVAPPDGGRYVVANYEAQHPPLYYLVLSIPDRLLAHLRLDLRTYALELLTVLLASLALPAIFLTFRLYLEDDAAAGLAALGVAWFPNFLPFLGRLTNDALAFPFIAWSIFYMARPGVNLARVVLVGVLVDLACATKTYALTLVPVYLVASMLGPKTNGQRSFNLRYAIVAVLCVCIGIGPILAANYLTSGQVVLLTEVRDTSDTQFGQRLMNLGTVPPIWFFTGLVQYFWWSGYWSFVVRGFYYIPLFAIPILLLFSLRNLRRGRLDAEHAWLHVFVIVCFVCGLWVHASMLRQTFGGGNEGWYADVLVGSVASVGLILLRSQCGENGTLRRVLAIVVVVIVSWNLLGRIMMLLFWTGQIGPGGALQGSLSSAILAGLAAYPWSAELDPLLPGAVGPAVVTVGIPLASSIALTGWALVAWTRGVRPG